jgi:hypothetical protein
MAKLKKEKNVTQVNFNIDNALFDKVKDLAFWETLNHSEIYNKSVAKFIQLYEEKFGKIKPRPTGNGIDSL